MPTTISKIFNSKIEVKFYPRYLNKISGATKINDLNNVKKWTSCRVTIMKKNIMNEDRKLFDKAIKQALLN